MTDASAERLQNADTEQDSTPPAGPLKRVAQLVAPAIPVRTDGSSKAEILGEFQKDDGYAEHYLAQARMRYDDVFKRAENVERRAGTLQTGVVFAVTFTLTGGALLLDTAKVPDTDWRKALAVAVFVVVVVFAWSGLHATLAAARTEYWKVVGRWSLQGKTYDSLDDARRHRAAAYIWCVNHNMAVNQWKADELGRALRWFIFGLAGLAVVAGLVAAYAVWGRVTR